MSEQCTAVEFFFGQCPKPGTPRVAMCVHEHLREGALCDFHAADAELERAMCKVCVDLPGDTSHVCDLRFVPAATSP